MDGWLGIFHFHNKTGGRKKGLKFLYTGMGCRIVVRDEASGGESGVVVILVFICYSLLRWFHIRLKIPLVLFHDHFSNVSN